MKDNEWLSAGSFEYSHHLLSAINVLSIHAKLLLAGADDNARRNEVERARVFLRSFVERLEALVRDAEARPGATVLGADPSLQQLADRFVSGAARGAEGSPLGATSLSELKRLVGSEAHNDLRVLIGALRELRTLVEQGAHADIARILGEL